MTSHNSPQNSHLIKPTRCCSPIPPHQAPPFMILAHHDSQRWWLPKKKWIQNNSITHTHASSPEPAWHTPLAAGRKGSTIIMRRHRCFPPFIPCMCADVFVYIILSHSLSLSLSACVWFHVFLLAPLTRHPILNQSQRYSNFGCVFFTLSVGSGCDIKEAVKKRACFITHATRKGAELRVKLGWKGYGTVTDRLGLVNSRARKRGYFDRKGLF